NVSGFLNVRFQDPIQPLAVVRRIDIQHNLIYGIGDPSLGESLPLIHFEMPSDGPVRFNHNTIIAHSASTGAGVDIDSNAVLRNFMFTNNIVTGAIRRSGSAVGSASLTASFFSTLFSRNILARQDSADYSAHAADNWILLATGEVGFVSDPAGGTNSIDDLMLGTSSRYRGAGLDRIDLGADLDLLKAAFTGASTTP
ncbi:MAG: hypothetical protein ABL958_11445, partial [Bdellovibrionia bacterium]